jgi:hypothetical protein
MQIHIVEVGLRSGSRLYVRFNDGSRGEIDITQVVSFEGVFARLRDQREFEKVLLDPDWGTICWPPDLDLAPETLYERITGKNPFELNAAPSSLTPSA